MKKKRLVLKPVIDDDLEDILGIIIHMRMNMGPRGILKAAVCKYIELMEEKGKGPNDKEKLKNELENWLKKSLGII